MRMPHREIAAPECRPFSGFRLRVRNIAPLFGILILGLGGTDQRREIYAEHTSPKSHGEEKREIQRSAFNGWLNEVFYIITDSERSEFRDLKTDQDRKKFIENFWQRRNPDPASPVNKFRKRYYRDLIYVKTHFNYLIPGLWDDRPRTYIVFGPPDKIQKPRMGSQEEHPVSPGASPSARVVERWVYRFIEGIGKDVPVEFADPSRSGEYRAIVDPLTLIDHTPSSSLAAVAGGGY